MGTHTLFYPAFMLAMLHAIVVMSVVYTRLRAASAGTIGVHFLEKGELSSAPASVVQTTQNLENLFEFPLLFYVVILFVVTYGLSDAIYAWLAWSYVILRYLHSFIHITYNRVAHRFTVFALSNLILIGIWFRVMAQVLESNNPLG